MKNIALTPEESARKFVILEGNRRDSRKGHAGRFKASGPASHEPLELWARRVLRVIQHARKGNRVF